MKMYSYIEIENEVAIRENTTNQLINTVLTKEKAKEICSKLNNGSGFNGYTPSFITKKLNISFKNVNSKKS